MNQGNNQKTMSFIDQLNAASTQFGTLFGAGVAAGSISVGYYIARGGYLSIFTPFITVFFLFLLYYLGLEVARLYQLWDYHSLFSFIYGKYGFIMNPIIDFSTMFIMLAMGALVVSGACSLFESLFGINRSLGAVIILVICLLGVMFGTELFTRLSGILTIAIIVIIVGSNVLALFHGGFAGVATNVSARWMPEGASVGKAIYYGFAGAGGYLSLLSVYLISCGKVKTKKDLAGTLRIGAVLNLVAFWLPTVCILGFCPEILQEDIQMLYIVTRVLPAGAKWIYSLLLMLSFVSTGIGVLFTIAQRFERYLPKSIEKPQTRNLIIQILVCVICFFGSKYALTTITMLLTTINPPLQYISYLIPLVLIAPVKIREKRKEEHI